MEALYRLALDNWHSSIDSLTREPVVYALEQGKVLYLPQLSFLLDGAEEKFLSDDWLAGTRKNISLEIDRVNGAQGSASDLEALRVMLQRFAQQASVLAQTLFPRYAPYLKTARTSFRPAAVENRATSWRKDDSRLHVDAFPSRPTRDTRILRIFCNIHPSEPRVWRVGEPFQQAAQQFLSRIGRPFPGSAALLQTLGITKSRRSEYDHIMLKLHDAMKHDLDYQRAAPQQEIAFAPGSTWICFSDQVLHAAMRGQFMLEQTLHVPIAAQYHPELSPLRALEALCGRALL